VQHKKEKKPRELMTQTRLFGWCSNFYSTRNNN
jgi:hypothetical protein